MILPTGYADLDNPVFYKSNTETEKNGHEIETPKLWILWILWQYVAIFCVRLSWQHYEGNCILIPVNN